MLHFHKTKEFIYIECVCGGGGSTYNFMFYVIKLQLINADIIYDTVIVTSRLFRKSFLIAGIIREWIMPFVFSH